MLEGITHVIPMLERQVDDNDSREEGDHVNHEFIDLHITLEMLGAGGSLHGE